MLVVVKIGLHDHSVGQTQVLKHLQAGNLSKYKYGIRWLLEECAWGGYDVLVIQGFVHIVLQLESLRFSLWIQMVLAIFPWRQYNCRSEQLRG